MIHHATISARHASPMSGAGHFDVTEERNGFAVWGESLCYGEFRKIGAALRKARLLARDYDARVMRERGRASERERRLRDYAGGIEAEHSDIYRGRR